MTARQGVAAHEATNGLNAKHKLQHRAFIFDSCQSADSAKASSIAKRQNRYAPSESSLSCNYAPLCNPLLFSLCGLFAQQLLRTDIMRRDRSRAKKPAKLVSAYVKSCLPIGKESKREFILRRRRTREGNLIRRCICDLRHGSCLNCCGLICYRYLFICKPCLITRLRDKHLKAMKKWGLL